MLDLKELERKLDDALDKETAESLKQWLHQKERGDSGNVAEGDAVAIVSCRAETGLMKFGDDSCGVFIRGDNALWYAATLDKLLDGGVLNWTERASLTELRKLLDRVDTCNEGIPVDELRSIHECRHGN